MIWVLMPSPKLYISSTIDIWKKVLTKAIWAGKKWAGFWQISMYTQYPIIRNSDQAPLVGFLKKSPISDSRRFLIFQVWLVTVSYPFLKFFQKIKLFHNFCWTNSEGSLLCTVSIMMGKVCFCLELEDILTVLDWIYKHFSLFQMKKNVS